MSGNAAILNFLKLICCIHHFKSSVFLLKLEQEVTYYLEVVCVEFPLFRIGATIAFGFSLVERLMLSRRSSKVLTPVPDMVNLWQFVLLVQEKLREK